MSEKRIRPRMHRRIPVKVELRFEGDAAGTGRLLEMSEGGLSFVAEEEIQAGSSLRLVISDNQGEVALKGKVVHSRRLQGELVLGVQFEAVTPAELGSIQSLLKRHRFNQFRTPLAKTV
jgi:hypothetical protein